MTGILNRVGCLISTTGTGTIVANTLISNRFNTPAEAGAVDGHDYYWLLEENNDYELFKGTWTLSGTTITRDTVIESKIGGVHGTTKMTLLGSATLRSPTPKEALVGAWQQIAQQVISSPAATVTFSSIPQTYTDLMLIGDNVTHSAGSDRNYQILTSNDGTNYSSNVVTSASIQSGDAGDLIAVFPNYASALSLIQYGVIGHIASNDLEQIFGGITGAITRHTGGLVAVRMNLSSTGNYTAGTFTLYGR